MKNTSIHLSGNQIQTTQLNENISKEKILVQRVINTKIKSPLTSEQASFIITKRIREFISNKSYNHMFSEGEFWKKNLDKNQGFTRMKNISADNIRKLTKNLGNLDEKEKSFLDQLLKMKFTATHATDANIINKNKTLSLFSRIKLEERNIHFARDNHSTQGDISELANDDFVFFSIEPGNGGFKHNSRFGKTIYAVDFDTPSFLQSSWVSLQEQYISYGQNSRKHIRDISEEAHKILSFNEIDIQSNMFIAKDFKRGLALSLIEKFRLLPSIDREKLLNTISVDRMNDIINGIYRPEVKVPKHFFINHENGNIKVSCGNGEVLSISDFDNYQIMSSAVYYNYKALRFASNDLKANISIIKRALMNNEQAIYFVHEQLENDHSLAKEIINFHPLIVKHFPTTLIDNESIMQHAIQKDAKLLEFASDRLRDNDELVSKAVSIDPHVLMFASERLQNTMNK